MNPSDAPTGRPRAAVDDGAGTKITIQFREIENMTYELDCAGTALVVRVFFPTTAGQWRIVAQTSAGANEPSRVEALRGIARACREGEAGHLLGRIDWTAVETAMAEVRAV
jgi:hypothetical protein